MSGRGIKRVAGLPEIALVLGAQVSKADLLEAAWHLAGQASDRYGDPQAHIVRLVEELTTIRANEGRAARKVRHLKRDHEQRMSVCPACCLEAVIATQEAS